MMTDYVDPGLPGAMLDGHNFDHASERGRSLPITILMNAGSGSRDRGATRREIESVLTASGRDTQLLLARRPAEIAQLALRAADKRPGILAGAGGDGTLNAVATVARARRLPFGAIALGTFNYFAREHDIPLEPRRATETLLNGTLRPTTIGEVNGHLFLNNASIGLYRKLIEQRELDKRRFGRNRFVALISGVAGLLREHHAYRLKLEIDARTVELSTLTVFFGRNALQMERLGLDEALCVERGELAVLAPRGSGRVQLLGLALRGVLARLETAENLQQYCAMEVRIDRLDGKTRHIRVALDGETVECTLPLHIRSVPDALQVIVPAAEEPEGR